MAMNMQKPTPDQIAKVGLNVVGTQRSSSYLGGLFGLDGFIQVQLPTQG